MPDPRRRVEPGALILTDVQPNDTAVIQCEAHNKHGSILINAYVFVVRKFMFPHQSEQSLGSYFVKASNYHVGCKPASSYPNCYTFMKHFYAFFL